MDEPPQLVILLVLLLSLTLSAAFSAVEVAFLAITPSKVRAMGSAKKSRVIGIIEKLKTHPQRVLSSILIVSNVVNTFAAGLATYAALQFFGDSGLAIATGVMSLLILTFTDIFPKSFAQRHAAPTLKWLAYPLYAMDTLLIPVTWLFDQALLVLKLGKPDRTVTEAELLAMVDIGTEEGELKMHEKELIQNVLSFTDTVASEIMRPRVDIVAISRDKTVAEAREILKKNPFSRLPVYDGTIDKVIGAVTIRMSMEEDGATLLKDVDLLDVVFAPESKKLRPLLTEMLSRRMHLCIILDEYGGTAGLLTLEDILEELVGEIEDERDVQENNIRVLNSRTIQALGETSLWDIDRKLGTKLDDLFPGKTVAYAILQKLARLPKENDRLRMEGAELTIEELEDNRIEKVKVEKL